MNRFNSVYSKSTQKESVDVLNSIQTLLTDGIQTNAMIDYDLSVKTDGNVLDIGIDSTNITGSIPVTVSGGGMNMNLVEIDGNAVETNAGVVGDGTLRVILASSQDNYLSAIRTNTNNINGKLPDLGTAVVVDSLPVNLASDQPNINVNCAQLNGHTVSTGSDFADIGTQRVVIAQDNPTMSVEVDKLLSNLIAVNSGTVDNGTQRVVLASDQPTVDVNCVKLGDADINLGTGNSDSGTQRVVLTADYASSVLQKNRLSLVKCRRTALYFNGSITGGAISFNLAYNLTTSAASAPMITSVAFEGSGATIFIKEIQIYMRIASGIHNTGWGSSAGQLTSGIGMYWLPFSGDTEKTIINDAAATAYLPNEPVKGNYGWLKYFHQNYETFDPGAGDVILRFHYNYGEHPLELQTTGGVYARFQKEDISINNVSNFGIYLIYYR